MTNVAAREIPDWPEHADAQARFHGQPGDMMRTFNADGSLNGFLIACPNCGVFGALGINSKQANWTVAKGLTNVGGVTLDAGPGDLNDVTTLSLTPSILKRCCGWHGYLRRGVFEQC